MNSRLRPLHSTTQQTLNNTRDFLSRRAKLFDKLGVVHDDNALTRIGCLLEEMSELIEALAHGDPVATLDALADLLYVVIGVGVLFDLPVEKAFWEVHASNMTKTPDDTGGQLRFPPHGKGPDYRAPNLLRVLEEHLTPTEKTDVD